jgi:dTDP-4-dehydrorhamnose reductase
MTRIFLLREPGQLTLASGARITTIRDPSLNQGQFLSAEANVEKLFIIGIDTLAGSNLAATLATRCEIDGARWSAIKRDPQATTALASIAACQPDWIVYCGPAAHSSWDGVDENIDWTAEKSRLRAISAAAKNCAAPLVYLSTDAIVDGPQIFSRETHATSSAADAVTIVELERTLVEAGALIIRTHLFGWSVQNDSFVERLHSSINDGLAIHACGTSYASPMLASDFAELLWVAHRKQLRGLFHLAGAERISQRQFACKFSELSPTAHHCDHPARETSLDSRVIQRELQSPLPLLREAIDRFSEQAHNGYCDRVAEFAKPQFESVAA